MGMSRLLMRQLREILRLKHEGLPHRAIARACGVGVGTVSEYLRRAGKAGLAWPLPPDLSRTQRRGQDQDPVFAWAVGSGWLAARRISRSIPRSNPLAPA